LPIGSAFAGQRRYSRAKEGYPTVCRANAGFISEGAFDSPDWIFETKLDGYRAIAVIDSIGKARIWSRNQLPLN
jgi:hypothetical protein